MIVRKRLYAIICMLLCVVSIYSQATLKIANFSISPNEAKEIALEMDNLVEIRAFQVRMTLPDGITLVGTPQLEAQRLGGATDEFGDYMASQKSLNYNLMDDGSYMFIVNSNDGLPFSGSGGAVITFDVKADEIVAGTTLKIKLADMELVGTDGVTAYNPSDASTKVTVRNLSYEVTYMLDGEVYEKDTVECGTVITPLPEPTKEGFTFSGWSEIPEIMPAENVTVTGTFIANRFKLTFMVDNEVYYTDTLSYGNKIPVLMAPVKEGYTFSGWSEIPEAMPAKDVTITGSFSINTYKVTYMVDGNVYSTDSVVYGASITEPDAPVKEGYTFSGWSGLPKTMPAKDVMVTGSFVTNGYILTYVVDSETYRTLTVAYGATITAEAEPMKEGHTFSGWSGLPTTMPANNVTVTGSFAINSYKITYTVDGEVHHTDSVAFGTELTAIEAPVKEGYTFSGWSEIPEAMPAKDVTITGSFSINTYKVTYMVDGNVYSTDSVVYGASITEPDAPVKEGYTFSGWSEIPDSMPAKDVTVTGSFGINTYKVTYMVDGNVYSTDSVVYGASITEPDAPVKEGYAFNGWSKIPEIMPAGNVMVIANFIINSYKVTYMVDGNVYHTDSVAYNSSIHSLDEPTQKGYTFSGWLGIPETMPANDVTVTGYFTINSYKITYIVDGQEHYTDSLLYSAAISILPEPSKKGYSFSGWSEIPETMPANDVTVTGTFTINTYKVTYIVDGAAFYVDSVTYMATITPPEYPIKEGYTFDGWSEVPETMPAEDITITGTFTPNGYLLIYMVDGETYRTILCNYDESIVPEAYPTKEGYSFSGWTGLPETMPAENVTVTGMFTINKYKLTYTVDGEVHHTDSVTFAETVIPIVEPEKEGYTFSGWTGVPETMPAKDVTVTGKFILNRTQTDAQGLVYELNQEGDAFEVSNYTSALVSDLVVPSDIYGVPVTALRDRAFMGSIGLKSIVLPESVVLVGDRAFYACYDLLFVEWNAEAPIAATCFDKPDQYGNMLVYVSDASVPIAYDGNVVVNGVAEKITLTAGLPLRNTREFTARHISYTHEFTKQTRIGESGGWEALVLPFDVQTVTNEEKGALLPFGKADFTASLPYWVAELQSNGTFAYVDAIRANTPFIMEVPNSEEYEDMYNIKGNVTFSAENVVVHATTSMPEPSGSNYALVGCYEGVESGSRVYALNDEEYTADGIEYMPGGVFVSGDRDIRPFEAYVYSNSAARAPYLRISGRNGTGLVPAVIGTTDDGWYTLQGIRLNGKPTDKGVYIHRGELIMVK